MPALSDGELRALLAEDADRGWRAFIDQYTSVILRLIARAGIRDRDEAMELYTLVCGRLAENDCARLRRRDDDRGTIGGWLAVVLRHVAIDWVRSRVGRRRLFAAVRHLEPFDRQVFEQYYWHDRTPSELAELLRVPPPPGRAAGLSAVLDSLERIERTLSDRQRSELVSLGMRTRRPVSLETDAAELVADPVADRPDPETAALIAETSSAFGAALADLPAEDAAILRLKYVQGLTLREIERALRIERVSDDRLRSIRERLRASLQRAGITGSDGTAAGLAFLEGEG